MTTLRTALRTLAAALVVLVLPLPLLSAEGEPPEPTACYLALADDDTVRGHALKGVPNAAREWLRRNKEYLPPDDSLQSLIAKEFPSALSETLTISTSDSSEFKSSLARLVKKIFEDDLFHRVRSGNKAALETILEEYDGEITRGAKLYVYKYNLPSFLVEDISQTVKENIIKSVNRGSFFTGAMNSSFVTWLRRVIHNAVVDEANNLQLTSYSDVLDYVSAPSGEGGSLSDPVHCVASQPIKVTGGGKVKRILCTSDPSRPPLSVQQNWMRNIVRGMGPKYLATYVLVIHYGYTHKEAAQHLKVASSTISMRMSAIKKRLLDHVSFAKGG